MNNHPLINETVLQMKYARIVNMLAERLSVSQPQALDIFYNSKTYRDMSNLDNHIHNMGDLYIVEEIVKEQPK